MQKNRGTFRRGFGRAHRTPTEETTLAETKPKVTGFGRFLESWKFLALIGLIIVGMHMAGIHPGING